MTDESADRFRAAGERASQIRREAFRSYSEAAGLVRDRLAEVEGAIRSGAPAPVLDLLRASLSVAVQMKELTERELDNADQNWSEWLGEARARQDEERIQRQERTTTSATRAAWAAAVAAFFSAIAAFWQILDTVR